MITARTKKQLIAFVIITMLGVAFVGGRYAKLDRLVMDNTYEVNAHFKESGGIFTGAEVTYRGVGIGQVSDMRLTRDGVNVVLSIEKDRDRIPSDTRALVGNKSAVGEQYVELQPHVDGGPYLKDGSVIEPDETATPVSTTELLTNLSNLVESVPKDQLRTVVSEFGAAFKGTGPELATIIDTSTSFIETANENFDVTRSLIRNSNVVLTTQAAKGSAIRNFSRDLALFSGTLAGNDKALRSVIDNGSATAIQLRTFLEENQVDLGRLIQNLLTTGRVVKLHLDGVRQILVMYPYMVAGGYTVTAKGPTGYDARFGLIMTQQAHTCTKGYDQSQVRTPQDQRDKPMNVNARCAEPVRSGENWINPRGAQHAPNHGRTAAFAQPIATYDAATGTVTWNGTQSASRQAAAGVDPGLFGKDAWKWMLVQPSMGQAGTSE
jgi:phospholipid/cholesterol/gamma-HCH transport system substrate-binding protein